MFPTKFKNFFIVTKKQRNKEFRVIVKSDDPYYKATGSEIDHVVEYRALELAIKALENILCEYSSENHMRYVASRALIDLGVRKNLHTDASN